MYDRQDYRQVQAGKHDGNEEYREHLRVDALFNVFFCHSDFLHDRESGLVFEAFRDLLVVNDEHAGYHEDR